VLGVTAKATDIEEGRARLMMASSVISFLLIIKIKINQIFFLNISNTLFFLFNFLSLQVKNNCQAHPQRINPYRSLDNYDPGYQKQWIAAGRLDWIIVWEDSCLPTYRITGQLLCKSTCLLVEDLISVQQIRYWFSELTIEQKNRCVCQERKSWDFSDKWRMIRERDGAVDGKQVPRLCF